MFETKGLVKIYKSKKGTKVTALDHMDLKFEEKGVVFILGKSGSGKSTLLNVLGGLDSYDSGEIIIKGKSSKNFKARDFDSYRNTYVGFIFQDYNILEDFTVAKNLGIALQLQRKPADEEAIEKLLIKVDLEGLGTRNPNELSGGQKQRVAIARALIKNPDIIMADEPTGNLDSKTGQQVFETLQKLGEEKLVLVVSHDRESAEKYATRIIELSDGKVISDIKRTDAGVEGTHKGIHFVNNQIAHIKRGYQLTKDDVELINRMIANSKNDIVISSDPSVSVEIDTQTKTKSKTKFIHTIDALNNYINYGPDDFKVIKSKLPYRDSFKMGAAGLRTKKFRLIMTILLSVIAFTFFALSDTLSSFDVAANTVQTMYDNNYDIASISRRDIKFYEGWDGKDTPYELAANFSSEDHTIFGNEYPGLKLHDRYDKPIKIISTFNTDPEGYSMYYTDSIKGFLELDDFDNLGFKQIEITGSYFPTNFTEIAITDYIADHFVKYGLKNVGVISNRDQLIGKNIVFLDKTFKITAILDSGVDIDNFKQALDVENPWEVDYQLFNKFEGLKDYILSNLVVKKGFSRVNLGTIANINFEDTGGGYISGEIKNYSMGYISFSGVKKHVDTMVVYTGTLPTFTTLGNNELLLSASGVVSLNYLEFYNKYGQLLTAFEEDYGDEPQGNNLVAIVNEATKFAFDRLLETTNNNLSLFIQGSAIGFSQFYGENIKILGFVEPTFDDLELLSRAQAKMIVNEEVYDSAVDKINSPSAAYFKITGNRITDISLFRFLEITNHDGYRYYVRTPFSNELTTVRFLVETLSQVFFWISVVFAVFSTLLMANFISMSISYKKKEIGILRAIGARSSDVFGIFFNESLIIAAIDFVVTVILSILIAIFANISLKASLGTTITIFAFGIRQILLLAIICGGVAFIASLIPVRKIANMKPIDAIKNA